MRLRVLFTALAVVVTCSSLAHGQDDLRPPVPRDTTLTPPEGVKGETGVVVLSIEIDRDGRVTAVKVLESGGDALDQAAVASAKRFTFEPATRNGSPIASRIRFVARFEPPPPPPPKDEPQKPADPAPPKAQEPAPPTEITVTAKKVEAVGVQRTVSREDLQRAPGGGGDPLRAVSSLPGIARAPAFTDMLVVRGSSPAGSGVFLDGVFLPRLTHFGGLTSVVPLEVLDRIDYYPGNFPARYGRIDGGVIELGLRAPSPDGRAHGVAQVDLMDARAFVEAPVGRGITVMAGARRSWVDAWLGKVMSGRDVGTRTAPYYYDAQLIAEVRPTSTSRLRAGVVGAYDAIRLVAKRPLGDEPVFTGAFDQSEGFVRAFVTHDAQPDPRVATRISFSAGPDFSHDRLGTLKVDSRIDVITLRAEADVHAAETVDVRTGLDLLGAPFGVTLRVPNVPTSGGYDAAPLSTQRPLTYDGSGWFARPGAFVEVAWRPVPRLLLVPALRGDYTHEFGDWTVSPRMNARLSLAKGPWGTTLRAGLGVFHQPPEYRAILPSIGTRDLVSSRAVHASLGVEQGLGEGVSVSVEGYEKWIDRMPSHDPSRGQIAYNANDGEGHVYGVEVLAKARPRGRFSGYLSYSISRATRRDAAGQVERLFELDQTHQLAAVASVELGRGWTAGTRYRTTTGVPYTPCVGGAFAADSGVYGCVSGAPYSARLPAFHQLDVRVEKRWVRGPWTFTTYLDVQNVTNRENAETVTYAYDKSSRRSDGGLPILPILGVRGER